MRRRKAADAAEGASASGNTGRESAGSAGRDSTDNGGEAADGEPAEKPKGKGKNLKAKQRNAMTRSEFMTAAKTQALELAGQSIKVQPKEYSTGSVGFYSNQKVWLDVGDIELQLQANIQFTVVGSKEWKD